LRASISAEHRRSSAAFYLASSADFRMIPGAPIAYWVSDRVRMVFETAKPLGSCASIGKGLDTGDNDRFLRRWFEVAADSPQWIPYLKGGPFRKWYGNLDYVLDWTDSGEEIRTAAGSNRRNAHNYFKSGITWTRISSAVTGFRRFPEGFIFDSTGPCLFPYDINTEALCAFLNTNLTASLLQIIAPTLDFQSGHVSRIPLAPDGWDKKRVEVLG